MYFWVYALLVTEFVLFIFAYCSFKGDLASPSIITLSLFIVSTVCYCFNLSIWYNSFGFKAYSLISISFLIMILSEKFISLIKFENKESTIHSAEKQYNNSLIYIEYPFNRIIFAFLTILVIFYCYRVYQSGVSMGGTGLLAIGTYKESGEKEGILRLIANIIRLSSYVFAFIFANNVFLCKQKIKYNLQAFMVVFYRLIMTFFSGNRIGIFTFSVSVFVMIYTLLNNDPSGKKIEVKKIIKKGAVFVLVFIGFFYVSRNVVKGRNETTTFSYYITYYCGSPLALFGQIVNDPSICHTPFVGYFGEKTFMEMYNDLYHWGIVSEPPADRLMIPVGDISSHIGNCGNEYTIFAGPYIDFGYFGTIIFIALFYGLFSTIYYSKIKGQVQSVSKCIYCSIYCFMFSMITLSFYQDTIRDYCRVIYVFYYAYIFMFCKFFVRFRDNNNK